VLVLVGRTAAHLDNTGGGRRWGTVWRVFSGTDIDIDHKKKVDLGALRDAECNGRGAGKPFSTVRGESATVHVLYGEAEDEVSF
jgi:hypothetical protein